MKRTQIQLDEATYANLRREAYERGCSISALVRETLARSFGGQRSKKPTGVRGFRFVGSGRSRQGGLAPVSERHDEALAEAVPRKRR
jgi:hypothetical protein